ncbi:hypothetical protein EUGRSUZ_F00078 [Eucalyptus grandis]|uniref:Calmodulin binding protein central domain-containing protein n=2 Tax=Eucalyptus grandis TaxID=71139 RepID=A0A059BJF6_EUCGR|nr:hypothetical protein EUGRSUZ_F00078 [Eucalyptus grandis]
MHIHGAVSEASIVEDSHGEFVKKHFSLLLSDYVWRIVGVAMGGQAHKLLTGAGIVTVRDFFYLISLDEARLRNVYLKSQSKIAYENPDQTSECHPNPLPLDLDTFPA